MKKLLLAAFAVFSLSFAGMAQTSAPAKKTSEKKTHLTTTTKNDAVAPASAKTTEVKAKETHKEKKSAVEKSTTSTNTKLKADGTPDKRYKENKNLKKDGTPDMRYKANKEKASNRNATKVKEVKKGGK